MTAMMFAAQEGHVLVAEKLLQHGAEVNAASSRGETVSHQRSQQGVWVLL